MNALVVVTAQDSAVIKHALMNYLAVLTLSIHKEPPPPDLVEAAEDLRREIVIVITKIDGGNATFTNDEGGLMQLALNLVIDDCRRMEESGDMNPLDLWAVQKFRDDCLPAKKMLVKVMGEDVNSNGTALDFSKPPKDHPNR